MVSLTQFLIATKEQLYCYFSHLNSSSWVHIYLRILTAWIKILLLRGFSFVVGKFASRLREFLHWFMYKDFSLFSVLWSFTLCCICISFLWYRTFLQSIDSLILEIFSGYLSKCSVVLGTCMGQIICYFPNFLTFFMLFISLFSVMYHE